MPFWMRSISAPLAEVPFWPLELDDWIRTVMRFQDTSRFVRAHRGNPAAQGFSGGGRFNLKCRGFVVNSEEDLDRRKTSVPHPWTLACPMHSQT